MPELTERQRYYKEHLDAAVAAGLTIAEYARRHDVPAYGLYDARRRIRARSGFVRVAARPSAAPTSIELHLPNGVRVHVTTDDVGAVLRSAVQL